MDQKPDMLRTSYFVDLKKRKMMGEEYPSVTVFIAELNDDGKYTLLRDGFIANDNVIENEEIGKYSGGDPSDFVITRENATYEEALAWLRQKETEALASGKYTAHPHYGGAIPHVYDVTGATPAPAFNAEAAAYDKARKKPTLASAVENGDHTMLSFLIASGKAKVADDEATFNAAARAVTQGDEKAFNIIVANGFPAEKHRGGLLAAALGWDMRQRSPGDRRPKDDTDAHFALATKIAALSTQPLTEDETRDIVLSAVHSERRFDFATKTLGIDIAARPAQAVEGLGWYIEGGTGRQVTAAVRQAFWLIRDKGIVNDEGYKNLKQSLRYILTTNHPNKVNRAALERLNEYVNAQAPDLSGALERHDYTAFRAILKSGKAEKETYNIASTAMDKGDATALRIMHEEGYDFGKRYADLVNASLSGDGDMRALAVELKPAVIDDYDAKQIVEKAATTRAGVDFVEQRLGLDIRQHPEAVASAALSMLETLQPRDKNRKQAYAHIRWLIEEKGVTQSARHIADYLSGFISYDNSESDRPEGAKHHLDDMVAYLEKKAKEFAPKKPKSHGPKR